MKNLKTRVAVGATILGLGGLTGLALSAGPRKAAQSATTKPLVRTEVVRRTTRVTKHAKPRQPVGAASSYPGQAAPVTAASGGGEGVPVTTAASGGGAAPVTTATSGGGTAVGDEDGEELEREDGEELEHEGGDD